MSWTPLHRLHFPPMPLLPETQRTSFRGIYKAETFTMPDLPSDERPARPPRLAEFFDLEHSDVGDWRPEEMASVFRHQLSAPIAFDLGRLPGVEAARLRVLAEAQGLLIRSFRDLLNHPHPPLELLRLVKEFGKAHQQHPASPLPRDIALALYYLAIFAAQVRWDRRITTLGDGPLRKAAEWRIAQEWMDEDCRNLARAGLSRLALP